MLPLRISGATKLTTLAPTALDEVGHVMLTSLPAMTSLNLGSMVIFQSWNTMTISATGLTGSTVLQRKRQLLPQLIQTRFILTI